MSLQGSQRRDQRRRLLVSWNRSQTASSDSATLPPRTLADYAPEALPERQPAIATLLPTGLGSFSLVAATILTLVGLAIGVGAYEPLQREAGRAVGDRFAPTLAAVGTCVDARSGATLAGWISQILLVGSGVVALVVRLMRRHRRDDYRGRYRAWGWLAGLFCIASCGSHMPLGSLLGTLVADTTGIPLGPQGYGWWVVLSTTLLGVVSLWAVLPLHERSATAIWLALGLAAWGASACCVWIGNGRETVAIAANATWAVGSGLVAVAMLAAARSVIREVRGECRNRVSPAKPEQSEKTSGKLFACATPPQASQPASGWQEEEFAQETDDKAGESHESSVPSYTESADSEDDRETRYLSKAERKRMKKLARISRVA